jgi:hypothetical protein
MQSKHRPVENIVLGMRWGLPWVVVLALSASVAYAMTVAVAVGPSAGDSPTTITVAQPPANGFGVAPSELAPISSTDPRVDQSAGALAAESSTMPGSIEPFSSNDPCATSGRMLYVGLNTWIPAEPRVAPCENDAP